MAATPVSVVTGAVTGLQDDLLQIAGIGIGISAALFALRKGWKVLTGTVR